MSTGLYGPMRSRRSSGSSGSNPAIRAALRASALAAATYSDASLTGAPWASRRSAAATASLLRSSCACAGAMSASSSMRHKSHRTRRPSRPGKING